MRKTAAAVVCADLLGEGAAADKGCEDAQKYFFHNVKFHCKYTLSVPNSSTL